MFWSPVACHNGLDGNKIRQKGNIPLPVAVRGSRPPVLKFFIMSLLTDLIGRRSRDVIGGLSVKP